MDIIFNTSKMRKICNSAEMMRKEFGGPRAQLLQKRLVDMGAADCLEDLRLLPGHYHVLENRGYEIAVSLDGPYRLIFAPAHAPVPLNDGSALDWRLVTQVTILRIEDYHGKKHAK